MRVSFDMYYVYAIQSRSSVDQKYIGVTEDLRQRLKDHNAGRSVHTSKFVPWGIAYYVAFPDKKTAYSFEKYLKSHSGRAFANKRLWSGLQACAT